MLIVKTILGIKRTDSRAILPTMSKGNVGIDLRVLTPNSEPITIAGGSTYKFSTGIKLDIPEGYYVEIVPRSSTGIKRELSLMNTVGVIDSSYKGEVIVAMRNDGLNPVVVENNDRLCQMIIHRDETLDFVIKEVEDVGTSDRGENGIGSTGR